MSIIKDKEKEVEQDIIEQAEVEKILLKASKDKVDKNIHADADKKKGQSVNWKPARRLPEIKAPEGFRFAWKHNTPENIRRLQHEGWDIANRVEHRMDVDMRDYYKKVNDRPASPKDSMIMHNELIGMIIPEEVAQARTEYHRQETEKQTRARLVPEKSANSFLRNHAKLTTTIEIN